MSQFNFIENLPVIILSFLTLIVFALFVWGGIMLLIAKRDISKVENTEKARKILFASFYAFFSVLLLVIIFYTVNYFLQKSEMARIQGAIGEFPGSSSVNFPPPPTFIKISGYYLNGPMLLKANNLFGDLYIYNILCKKGGEYVIIDIGTGDQQKKILKDARYGCWLKNCDGGLNNLYVALFWTPKEKYDATQAAVIINDLKEQNNPVCLPSQ